MFQPSTSTWSNPCSAAKSMTRFTLALFAPWRPLGVQAAKSIRSSCTEGRSVYDHVLFPAIISHHTPMYFTGRIHDVSS